MKLFYCRVSTQEQNTARQIELAHNLGIDDKYIFTDKQSGKNAERAELKRMIEFAREGDTVYCESISRIARNTKDLLNIVETLKQKGVEFVSQKENIDTTTPQGEFMLTVFAALAKLERDCILEKQAEGIAEAKKRGVYKGRKPKQIDEKRFARMCAEWRADERTAVSIQKAFGVSATTFYKWVNDRGL